MKLNTTSNLNASIIGSCKMMTLAMLSLSLVACGGGGGSGSSASTAVSITSINHPGIVASNAASGINITLFGTNFTSGMTLNVTDKADAPIPNYSVGSTTFNSANGTLSTILTIASGTAAPADKYVNVNVMSSGSKVASTILGVAQNYKKLDPDIQAILNNLTSQNCYGCHDGTNTALPNYFSVTTSANTLINASSTGCSNRTRVVPGDPRRSSSVLVDKILAPSTGIAPCNGAGMPYLSTSLSTQDIDAIEDWIAGGAF